jgi:serine/threonine protein kinase
MAPETIIEGNYTRKTDIWSLGCTLLELATGIIPWTEKKLDPHKIMLHIGQTQELPYIPKNLPEITQKLIKSCLNRDADQRSTTE